MHLRSAAAPSPPVAQSFLAVPLPHDPRSRRRDFRENHNLAPQQRAISALPLDSAPPGFTGRMPPPSGTRSPAPPPATGTYQTSYLQTAPTMLRDSPR